MLLDFIFLIFNGTKLWEWIFGNLLYLVRWLCWEFNFILTFLFHRNVLLLSYSLLDFALFTGILGMPWKFLFLIFTHLLLWLLWLLCGLFGLYFDWLHYLYDYSLPIILNTLFFNQMIRDIIIFYKNYIDFLIGRLNYFIILWESDSVFLMFSIFYLFLWLIILNLNNIGLKSTLVRYWLLILTLLPFFLQLLRFECRFEE